MERVIDAYLLHIRVIISSFEQKCTAAALEDKVLTKQEQRKLKQLRKLNQKYLKDLQRLSQ